MWCVSWFRLGIDWPEGGSSTNVTMGKEKETDEASSLQSYRYDVEPQFFFTLYLSPLRWQTPYTDWETWPCSCIFIYLLAACIEFLSSEICTHIVIVQPICFKGTRWFRFFCAALEKLSAQLEWNYISHWDKLKVKKPERFYASAFHISFSHYICTSSLVYFCKNIQTTLLIPITLSMLTWQNDRFYLCKTSALPLNDGRSL